MNKLLLLFTLLSAACYGQDAGYYVDSSAVDWTTAKTRVVINGRLVYDTAGNLVGYETGDLINWQYHELPSLEEKLLLYAEECYNDSSKYCYRLICDWGCVEIPCNCDAPREYIEGYEINHCDTRYIHRKPTFENFIEWLKNK